MKRLTVFAIIGLIFAAGIVYAAPQRYGRDLPRTNVQRQLKQMERRLHLTSDQVNQIRPILRDQQRQIRDLRAKYKNQSGTVDRSQVRQELQQLRQNSQQKLDSVLTQEQVDQLHQRRGKK